MDWTNAGDRRKPEHNQKVIVELTAKGWQGSPIYAISTYSKHTGFDCDDEGYELHAADDTGLYATFASPVARWCPIERG